MAITRVTGNDGTIGTGVFDQSTPNATHYAIIRTWRAAFPRVVTNVTSFADTIQHNRLGLLSIDGGLTGTPVYDATSTSPGVKDRAAGGSSTVLQIVTGCSYTAVLAYSSFEFNVDKEGESAFSASFVNGDSETLTETWDESP